LHIIQGSVPLLLALKSILGKGCESGLSGYSSAVPWHWQFPVYSVGREFPGTAGVKGGYFFSSFFLLSFLCFLPVR
jgi:hypothetical protein